MPNRQVSFAYFLDPEEHLRLRSTFNIFAGRIEKFAVQLELDNQIVVRFDNSHGFVHQHVFISEDQEETRELKFGDNQQAYEYCYQYLRTNWRSLIDQFRRNK